MNIIIFKSAGYTLNDNKCNPAADLQPIAQPMPEPIETPNSDPVESAPVCRAGQVISEENCANEIEYSLTAVVQTVCAEDSKQVIRKMCQVTSCRPGYVLESNRCVREKVQASCSYRVDGFQFQKQQQNHDLEFDSSCDISPEDYSALNIPAGTKTLVTRLVGFDPSRPEKWMDTHSYNGTTWRCSSQSGNETFFDFKHFQSTNIRKYFVSCDFDQLTNDKAFVLKKVEVLGLPYQPGQFIEHGYIVEKSELSGSK